ncbi:MAG: transketolase [Phycisphaerae bacterium]|nr:transketolase [Phycisphaerae bacterium]
MAITLTNKGLTKIEELCVQTLRFLAVDGVQKANAGHPGMPMGMAAPAFLLWDKHLKHNPKNPLWHNRDRFVLSAGHGSMLLYSLLYMNGYDITLEDLKQFRQSGSKTPGHPEYEPQFGIEVTTGPLGQGIGNAVGMGIAQKYLASYFNRDGFNLIDYKIYSICGDGCLQEGISSEASSLAGHLGLDNLIVIYDDNHITIDGDTSLSFTEDVVKRYEAYGWYVQEIGGDGNDMEAFDIALKNAKKEKGRPSIIKLRSHIGFGSPNKQDTEAAHGSPLGEEEVKLTKARFGWDTEKTFYVPGEVTEHMKKVAQKGADEESKWQKMFDGYAQKYPELAKQFNDWAKGCYGDIIKAHLPQFEAGSSMATRSASGKVLNALMPHLPCVLGGSADLTPSNNTWFEGASNFKKDDYSGRYIRYGVREHVMGAILNGISVSSMLRAYGGTFFVFSDYMRPAVRVAALSHYPSIFVFTHDSIGVGEDGPTHQPVEHLASFRAMPGLVVLRPADANETAYAWKYILEHRDGPVAIMLTRQGIPVLDQKRYASAANLEKGAYALVKVDKPDCILMGTGSEVSIAIIAAEELADQGIKAQVVSMPSWELFEKQSKAYKDSVLPPNVKARVAVEAGVENGWCKYVGDNGIFIGLSTFGESGTGKACYVKFGITPENVVKAAKKTLGK